ncbi:MAG TPA: tetratricopeptide repeat protein [Chloroflexi bacterium]|nr:tetratricopeptide repeat protein [Chloroflexota bacterium]
MVDQVANLLQYGIAAARAGRAEEARQALIKVIEMDEHNESAWLWLSGVVDTVENRYICLENVLSINPRNGHAQAGLQWLEAQHPDLPARLAQEPPATEERCPRCEAPVPYSGASCPNCGQALVVVCPACRDYIEVRKTVCPTCGQQLGNFHDGVSYYLTLTRAYLANHRGELAETTLSYVEAEAAKSADAGRYLGEMAILYEQMSKTDQAIAIYKRAIEHTPDQASLYARLGTIYRRRSMPDEARSMYQQAIKRAQGSPEILFELARLDFEENGATKTVLEILQEVIRRRPDHVVAHVILGDLYVEWKQKGQAVDYYEKACELSSEKTLIGQEARRKLERLRPSLPEERTQGWGETFRRLLGLMLLPGLAALINAGVSPWRISLVACLALFVAGVGGYLWVCAVDIPRNPAMRALFGPQGVKSTGQKALVGLPGAILWALAFGLILWRV